MYLHKILKSRDSDLKLSDFLAKKKEVIMPSLI